MARKKKRARGLVYAEKLARLKTVYRPSFAARKRFSPQQKAAITRQWRRLSHKAAYYYSKGFRQPPRPEALRAPTYAPPVRKKRKPKKPPKIDSRRELDTTFADVALQPFWRWIEYIKRKRRQKPTLFRILFEVNDENRGQSPTFTEETTQASSRWYNLDNYTTAMLETFLDRWGDILEIATVARR